MLGRTVSKIAFYGHRPIHGGWFLKFPNALRQNVCPVFT